MKYIIYVRVSSDKQETAAQQHRCVKHALGLSKDPNPIYSIHSDDNVSAVKIKLEKRKGIMAALNSMEENDMFISVSLSRMARNTLEALEIRRLVKEKKGTIVLIDQPHIVDSDLIYTIIAAVAQQEAQTISINTKAALSYTKSVGRRVGYVPYGYKAVESPDLQTKKLKPVFFIYPDENEQSNIQKMLDWTEEGLTLRQIAKNLNSNGLLSRTDTEWSHVSIHTILKNRDRHLVAAL